MLAVLSFNSTLVYAINSSSHATGTETTNITSFNNTLLNTTSQLFFNLSRGTGFHHSTPTSSSELIVTFNHTTSSSTRMDYNSSTASLPDSESVRNSSHSFDNFTQPFINNSSFWSNSSFPQNITSVASNITGPFSNFTKAVSCLNTTTNSFPNTTMYCNDTQLPVNTSSNTKSTTAANTTFATPHSFGNSRRPKVLVASTPEKTKVPKAVFAHYMV